MMMTMKIKMGWQVALLAEEVLQEVQVAMVQVVAQVEAALQVAVQVGPVAQVALQKAVDHQVEVAPLAKAVDHQVEVAPLAKAVAHRVEVALPKAVAHLVEAALLVEAVLQKVVAHQNAVDLLEARKSAVAHLADSPNCDFQFTLNIWQRWLLPTQAK